MNARPACKLNYYNNKVAALKDTYVKRLWKEMKVITGQSDSYDKFYLMLNETITSPAVLGERFSNVLADLTAHFSRLEPIANSGVILDVPGESLVDNTKASQGFASNQAEQVARPVPMLFPTRSGRSLPEN